MSAASRTLELIELSFSLHLGVGKTLLDATRYARSIAPRAQPLRVPRAYRGGRAADVSAAGYLAPVDVELILNAADKEACLCDLARGFLETEAVRPGVPLDEVSILA